MRDVTVAFNARKVLQNFSLDVRRGEILGFVSASGAGKSVLLRTVLGLNRKQAGTIKLFGIDLDKARSGTSAVDTRYGVSSNKGRCLGAHGSGERPGPDARIPRFAEALMDEWRCSRSNSSGCLLMRPQKFLRNYLAA